MLMTKCFKRGLLDDEKIIEVSKALKDGKSVVFPTDTVYGIGTNALCSEACERIYEIKGRPKEKPLIVLISDKEMLELMVEYIDPLEQKLIEAFWPGPLTIKFKKKLGVIPDIVSAHDGYERVRFINEGIVFKLSKYAGVPIVAPSANLSGSPTGIKIENIIEELDGKVDYILDFGDIESDVTSTIVEVKDDKVVILREGKISEEEIKRVVD